MKTGQILAGLAGMPVGRVARWLLPNGGTLLVVLILLLTANVWAQPQAAPSAATTAFTRLVPYQGRLGDSAGVPLTGVYPMIFRFYNSPDPAAPPLWEEQWTGSNSVQVSDGLFNVMLGSLNAISQNLVNDNSALWLGITVGTDDEMFPRVQVGSVINSFRADEAATVSDGAITTPKMVDGAVTEAKLADGAVTRNKLSSNIDFVPPTNSITTTHLMDGAVTNMKMAPEFLMASLTTAVEFTEQNVWVNIFSLPITPTVRTTYLVFGTARSMHDFRTRVPCLIETETGEDVVATFGSSHAFSGHDGTSSSMNVGYYTFEPGPHQLIMSCINYYAEDATLRGGTQILAIPFAPTP